MGETGLELRCLRCGSPMDLKDPTPGMPWSPQQYWVCPACGRHFWTTYPPPKPAADEGTPSRGSAPPATT